MGEIGLTEVLLILAIALLVFGPGLLPDMGRSLGLTLREFRNAIRGEGDGMANPEQPKKASDVISPHPPNPNP